MTIRVARELESAAADAAKLSKRSLGKQIEFWAAVGREVCGKMTESDVFMLLAGRASLEIAAPSKPVLSTNDLIAQVESQRESGELAATTTTAKVRIQADPDHPGLLQLINVDGSIERGVWKGGQFVRMPDESVAEQ
ncbi:MAG: hypothetical protein GKR94_18610 [Gammaproteobacteria bacterium]|nr:hypothetical protein [Gammaproteobacteria bacterium]